MSTSIGIRLGSPDGYTMCHTYPARTPILHISAGDTILNLSLDSEHIPTEEDLLAVRSLLDAVREFAAEVERLGCGAPAVVAS